MPVPSSEYLAIHAASAKVAQLSGPKFYIDKMGEGLKENILCVDGAFTITPSFLELTNFTPIEEDLSILFVFLVASFV